MHNGTATHTHRTQPHSSVRRYKHGSPSVEHWQRLCSEVTAASCSCGARTQPAPPALGRGRQRWRAAGGCNACGDGRRLWSRDPDTDPRRTRETPHSPAGSLKERRHHEKRWDGSGPLLPRRRLTGDSLTDEVWQDVIGHGGLAVGGSALPSHSDAGHGRELPQAGVVEGVGRVVWHLRRDLQNRQNLSVSAL